MDVQSFMIVYHFLVFVFCVAGCSEVSIDGGKDVKKLHPWMVSVQKDEIHLCGGILIQDQWVLTAAHCLLFFENIKSVTVLIGTLSLSKIKKGSQRVGIIDYEYPEKFSVKTKEHDIMLLKLRQKVKVKPKKLPKKEQDIRPGTKCVVTGWGTSAKLQMLEVKVVDRNQCNKDYENYLKITNNMLCAGSMKKNRGTCKGDSGGPLKCKRDIVGIVSGAKECGDPRKPTVYTFLSENHISWINSVLRKHLNTTFQKH